MSVRAFVDTNILVYAHDAAAGERHDVAVALMDSLWTSRSGVLSTQVLQEFSVSVRKRAQNPMPREELLRTLDDYMAWEIVVNDQVSVREAIVLEERYQISFWDALIVQAANAAAVETLYSEDLSHGQRYGAVELVNPFA